MLKVIGFFIALIGGLLMAAVFWLWPSYPYLPAEPPSFTAERLPGNPLIYGVEPEHGYVSVNGPSVIRVPDWVEDPLGRFYLYFAHHKGSFIRLAYADTPSGPWTVFPGGVLSISDSGFPVDPVADARPGAEFWDGLMTYSPYVVRDQLLLAYRALVADKAERQRRGINPGSRLPHIASPELVVDEQGMRLVMFFHGQDETGMQSSGVALSVDGLNFSASGQRIAGTYLRHFYHNGWHYLLGMPGVLHRSQSLLGPWKSRSRILFEPDMRHAGLYLDGNDLTVFWSMVGYSPERILFSRVDLSNPDWDSWQATAPADLLLPEAIWEGGLLPAHQSLRGEIDKPAKELRDPYVFQAGDELYLYYVGGGEQGIGIARLQPASAGKAPDS